MEVVRRVDIYYVNHAVVYYKIILDEASETKLPISS